MKILALADEVSHSLWDFDPRTRLEGVDLILSCGDLPNEYLEYLTMFTKAPILYVHGNHDDPEAEPGGCLCIDDRLYIWQGIRLLGLGGSVHYNTMDDYQYTERQMERRLRHLGRDLRRAGGCDILLTHAPALGLNDGADPAHKGFACFNTLLESYQPRYFIHGHNHLRYDHRLPRVCTHGSTTVINACERYSFDY